MGDSDSSDDEKNEVKASAEAGGGGETGDGEETLKGDGVLEKDFAFGNAVCEKGGGNGNGNGNGKVHGGAGAATGRTTFRGRGRSKRRAGRDLEMGVGEEGEKGGEGKDGKEKVEGKGGEKGLKASFQLSKAAGMTSMSTLEQSMPADAVLAKEGAEEVGCVFDVLCFWLANFFGGGY